MESTREHILLTAFKLFLKNGYKGVSMNMLVDASGLSKGAFYHYFENKEQLFVESLDNLFFSYAPYNQPPDVELKNDLWENIMQYINNARYYIKEMNKQLGGEKFENGYYKLMIDAFNHAPDFYLKIEKSNQQELAFWRRVFSKARDNGEIKGDLNIDLLARQMQYVQDGVGLHAMFTGEMDELYDIYEKIFKQVYDMIKI